MGSEGKVKPDGWVAWHSEGGLMIDDTSNCHNPDGFFVATRREVFELKQYRVDDGWRIRPVKLVFLDEVETQNKVTGEVKSCCVAAGCSCHNCNELVIEDKKVTGEEKIRS